MAETVLTVQKSNISTGITPTNQAIDTVNGNKFPNNGKTRVRFIGTTGATGTATFISQIICSRGDTHSQLTGLGILNGTVELECGPFPKERFNDSDGNLRISYQATMTGVLINVTDDA